MKLKLRLLGGLAIAVALASPSFAADKVKVALITKFPFRSSRPWRRLPRNTRPKTTST